jgi:hypothetical protein
MELAEARGLVERVATLDVAGADCDRLRVAAADVRSLQCFLEGRAVAIARRLAEVSCAPQRELAAAGRTSLRQAERLLERGAVADAAPAFGAALEAGSIGADHLDVFGRALRSLEPGLRPRLTAGAAGLVAVAQRASPDELDRALRAELRRIRRDDGQARLERQRRAVRLRTWVDGEGMWCLHGRFDPETGLRLDRRLHDTLEARFAEQTPPEAPSDPRQRQDFLRAHALCALIEGRGPRAGAPEIIVVVDATQPDDQAHPAIDWGLPVELPTDVLLRLFPTARTHPVVVRNGVIVHAPGQLDLGRTTRLANRAQRRALRALYPTCAIPGCDVRFEHCDIHHVTWWEAPHCGRTDFDNLLPLCSRHHHATHAAAWHLTLRPDRTLTITYPDGTRETTSPPRRHPPHTNTQQRTPMRT